MAFKKKLKGAWRRVSNLDDETQSIRKKVDDRIPYQAISKKLKEIMEQNVDVVGRKILIPNYYAIYFNEADRDQRLEVEDVMCNELKEELFHEMRKINPEQSKGDVVISANTDPAIEKGQFKVVHRMKKPSGEEPITINKTSSETVAPPDDDDLKQTVVEAAPDFTSADEQQTIVQMPESSVLYKLLIRTDDGTNEQLVTKEMVTIGRSSQDDVILESSDFSISRAHATLEARDEMYYLTPVGINGTFVNGEELELKKEVQIFPEDEIKIMNYKLTIKAG